MTTKTIMQYLISYRDLNGNIVFIREVGGAIASTSDRENAKIFEGKTDKSAIKAVEKYLSQHTELSYFQPKPYKYYPNAEDWQNDAINKGTMRESDLEPCKPKLSEIFHKAGGNTVLKKALKEIAVSDKDVLEVQQALIRHILDVVRRNPLIEVENDMF